MRSPEDLERLFGPETAKAKDLKLARGLLDIDLSNILAGVTTRALDHI